MPLTLDSPATQVGEDYRARRAELGQRLNLYQLWLRSFTPEGTLRSAAQRLPSLAELGVKMVMVSPFLKQSEDSRPEFWSPRMKISKAGHARNPYRLADYDRVDEEFGVEADVIDFAEAAHRLGMRVMMDVVFYHTGPDFKRVEFQRRDSEGKAVLGKWGFPVLDYENPAVRDYVLGKLEDWATLWNVDGFRCDVSSGIPVEFWREARLRMDRINPELILLGDGLVEELRDVFDLGYNEPYYRTLCNILVEGEPVALLPQWWRDCSAELPPRSARILYGDNLDKKRASVLFGERGAAIVAVLNFTLPGVPFVYNGQEFGDATPCEILSRQSIRWDVAHLDPTTLEVPWLLTVHRELYRLRNRMKALQGGAIRWLQSAASGQVLAYSRELPGQTVWVVLNLSNRKQKTEWLASESCLDLSRPLLAERATLGKSDGRVVAELGAYAFWIGASPWPEPSDMAGYLKEH